MPRPVSLDKVIEKRMLDILNRSSDLSKNATIEGSEQVRDAIKLEMEALKVAIYWQKANKKQTEDAEGAALDLVNWDKETGNDE